jgi:hypothetical protein
VIYSGKIVKAGLLTGQWVVTPQYTRVDGTIAPDITALSANGIELSKDDIVLCVESINSFDHGTSRIFDDNAGACPIIIATFEQLLTLALDLIVKGKVTLGTGSKKMVLGDPLQTWAQAKDAEIAALYTWAKTGVAPGPTGGIAPFPGTPAETNWNTATLSENHHLD